MHLKKWIAVFFIIHAFGCMAARQPAWVANGNHPGYSSDKYLVGVGLSSRTRDTQADVQRADTNARLEVAKQLKVKIKSSLASVREQKDRAFLPDSYTSETSIDVREDVELMLEGITIVGRYYSEKDHLRYAVAVLDKSETAKRLSSDMVRHRRDVEAYTRQSDNLLESRDIIGALQAKIKALANYRQYVSKGQMAAVLNPHVSERLEALPKDPYDGLIDLKNRIDLAAVGGDMQTARIGGGLGNPLVVTATYNRRFPIANLPVKATFQGAAGRAEHDIVTAMDGKAAIKVLSVTKTGRHINPVAVSVDWARIAGEALGDGAGKAWGDLLSGPSVVFKYKLRVPGVSNVLIRLCSRGGSGVDAASVLHPTSVDHLRKEGFLIKRTGRGRSDGSLCSGVMGIDSIVRKYKPVADILLVENVDVEYSGRRGRGHVFRARMSVTAYDMAYGEIIASMEGEALGGGSSRKKAAERAIKDVADELIPRIASRIAEAL